MRTRALLATVLARWVSFACIILIACGGSGCGGGSSPSSPIQPPPPPPSPDFGLSISPSSTTISQGTTSSALQVSVQALQGFSGDVQITLNGIPVGITSFPQSPFTVASGGTATLLIGASQIAATGSASITMQATSGKLSHAANLALTIQAGTTTASRTTYARTDSQSALDDPSGEPHHRHVVYDPANRHLFVANRARNRVEIFSTLDGSQIGSVDIAGAASADLSPDAHTVWVGTTTEQIAAIDTATLQRTILFSLPESCPFPTQFSIALKK